MQNSEVFGYQQVFLLFRLETKSVTDRNASIEEEIFSLIMIYFVTEQLFQRQIRRRKNFHSIYALELIKVIT